MLVIRFGMFFGAGLLIIYLLYKILVQNVFVMSKRLEKVREITDIEAMDILNESDTVDLFISSGKLYNVPVLGGFYKKQIEALETANIPMKPKEYLLSTIGVFILFLIGGTFVTGQLFIGLALGLIGFILPSFYVNYLEGKRTVRLDEQLPEFLNALSNGLRSGLSLNQAIGISVEDVPDPIGWEFKRVLSDMNMGRTLESSLGNLRDRTKNDNIALFVNAMIIQKDVGGNLSENLDLLANTIRGNASLQRHFKSTIAQNKLSGIIIGFLPVGLIVVLTLMTPDYMMPLFTEPLGRIMLLGVSIMMGLGIFIIKKITDLEV